MWPNSSPQVYGESDDGDVDGPRRAASRRSSGVSLCAPCILCASKAVTTTRPS